jgi:hypothetical protein
LVKPVGLAIHNYDSLWKKVMLENFQTIKQQTDILWQAWCNLHTLFVQHIPGLQSELPLLRPGARTIAVKAVWNQQSPV